MTGVMDVNEMQRILREHGHADAKTGDPGSIAQLTIALRAAIKLAQGGDGLPEPDGLVLKTRRAATADEVESLVWGTGGLSYSWWHGAHKTPKGFWFRFDDPSDDEGTFKGNRSVSNQQILDAAARFLAEGRGGEDAKDKITESIGYADAIDADVILQYAVLGSIVYG